MECFDNVVLVGAGCAIAPAIGHAQRLFMFHRDHSTSAASIQGSDAASSPLTGPKPRNIWLVLTVVYRDMFAPFADDLAAFAGNDAFHLMCFESGPYGGLFTPETHSVTHEEEAMVPVPVRLGMPDLQSVFQEIRSHCGVDSPVAVVVAGPAPVEHAAVRASKACNFTLHIEPNSW